MERLRRAEAVEQRDVQLPGADEVDGVAVARKAEQRERYRQRVVAVFPRVLHDDPVERRERVSQHHAGAGDACAAVRTRSLTAMRSSPESTAPTATMVVPSWVTHESAKVVPYLR